MVDTKKQNIKSSVNKISVKKQNNIRNSGEQVQNSKELGNTLYNTSSQSDITTENNTIVNQKSSNNFTINNIKSSTIVGNFDNKKENTSSLNNIQSIGHNSLNNRKGTNSILLGNNIIKNDINQEISNSIYIGHGIQIENSSLLQEIIIGNNSKSHGNKKLVLGNDNIKKIEPHYKVIGASEDSNFTDIVDCKGIFVEKIKDDDKTIIENKTNSMQFNKMLFYSSQNKVTVSQGNINEILNLLDNNLNNGLYLDLDNDEYIDNILVGTKNSPLKIVTEEDASKIDNNIINSDQCTFLVAGGLTHLKPDYSATLSLVKENDNITITFHPL